MEKKVLKTEKTSFKVSEIPLTRKELKNLLNYHIPCLCCGMEMLHPDIYRELMECKDLSCEAKDVIPILEPFERIMHPVERQVFNMFKTMSAKYPDKNFKELLVMKKDVHELALVKIQSVIFNKISFYRRILPKKMARALRKLMIKTNDIIFDPEPHKPFSRRIFIHKIKSITKNLENEKLKMENCGREDGLQYKKHIMPERSIVRVRCTRLHALRAKLNTHMYIKTYVYGHNISSRRASNERTYNILFKE